MNLPTAKEWQEAGFVVPPELCRNTKTQMNKPPDQPETLQEWLHYVRAYQANIYVRHEGVNVALGDLPPELWAKHVAGWLTLGQGHVPCRVLETEEQTNKPK